MTVIIYLDYLYIDKLKMYFNAWKAEYGVYLQMFRLYILIFNYMYIICSLKKGIDSNFLETTGQELVSVASLSCRNRHRICRQKIHALQAETANLRSQMIAQNKELKVRHQLTYVTVFFFTVHLVMCIKTNKTKWFLWKFPNFCCTKFF